MILSALAEGRSRVDLGPEDPGDDVLAMRAAIGALGCGVDGAATGTLTVTGLGRSAPTIDARIDAGDAGTVARFTTSLAATLPGRTRIDGSPRLLNLAGAEVEALVTTSNMRPVLVPQAVSLA